MPSTRLARLAAAVGPTLLLAACGGGGGGGSAAPAPPPPPVEQSDFDRGIFSDPASYEAMCASPRGAGFPDSQGSTEDENEWLRAWSHDLYLWYDEIIDEDPRDYSTLAYFDLMQTFELTPSGKAKDDAHFAIETAVYEQLQSGVSAGYGMVLTFIESFPPREILVAYTLPDGPADDPGNDIARGTRIVTADGVDVRNGADTNTLNNALSPAAPGETHTFEVENFDGSNRRTVTLVSQELTEDPVPVSTIIGTAGGDVGYMVFNDHNIPAERRLVEEMEALAAAGVEELILDLRYNLGGFIDIASQAAFMIAGDAAEGRVFSEIQFNDKHPDVNPVTGRLLEPDLFHETTLGISLASGSPLPRLNLSRVIILGSEDTCSASESIINGLRGVDVDVVLIGGTTCGKPYGFYPTDNCGTTYFSIQLRTLNAKGFGDYADGFIPTESPGRPEELPGCVVADDFSAQLGDVNEARLSAALNYLDTGACPATVSRSATTTAKSRVIESDATEGEALRDRFALPGSIVGRPR